MNTDPFVGFANRDNRMRQKYRNVFSKGEGLEVLRDILDHCGYFEANEPDNRDLMILKSFAEELVLNMLPISKDEKNAIKLSEARNMQLEAQIRAICSIKFTQED